MFQTVLLMTEFDKEITANQQTQVYILKSKFEYSVTSLTQQMNVI